MTKLFNMVVGTPAALETTVGSLFEGQSPNDKKEFIVACLKSLEANDNADASEAIDAVKALELDEAFKVEFTITIHGSAHVVAPIEDIARTLIEDANAVDLANGHVCGVEDIDLHDQEIEITDIDYTT
jgi:hypothetical protein